MVLFQLCSKMRLLRQNTHAPYQLLDIPDSRIPIISRKKVDFGRKVEKSGRFGPRSVEVGRVEKKRPTPNTTRKVTQITKVHFLIMQCFDVLVKPNSVDYFTTNVTFM